MGLPCKLMLGLMLFFSLPTHFLAKDEMKTLLEYHHDIDGDGFREQITVYGVPLKENQNYYQKVWAKVKYKDGRIVTIDLESGYEPKLDFVDLNHDGMDDILFSSATGGSGGLYHTKLYSAKNGTLKEIPLPESIQMEGAFQDQFKATLTIANRHPLQLDLSNRKKSYISLGLYQKNGKLNEPLELMIDPIAFFDIIQIQGKYGLKSYQQVSGAYHADRIGTVEVDWLYDNGKWIPQKIKWQKIGAAK